MMPLTLSFCCMTVEQRNESPLIDSTDPGQAEAAIAQFPNRHSVASVQVQLPRCITLNMPCFGQFRSALQ